MSDNHRNRFTLIRWQSLGIEQFLSDEQSGESPIPGKSDNVSLTELLDLIDQKYTMLRRKLLHRMIYQFSGETTWEILDESEKFDLLEQVVAHCY